MLRLLLVRLLVLRLLQLPPAGAITFVAEIGGRTHPVTGAADIVGDSGALG